MKVSIRCSNVEQRHTVLWESCFSGSNASTGVCRGSKECRSGGRTIVQVRARSLGGVG